MRCLFASVALAASLIACTETPSSFPPCIYTAPCPDSAVLDEAGTDDSASDGDAGDSPDLDAESNAEVTSDGADGE